MGSYNENNGLDKLKSSVATDKLDPNRKTQVVVVGAGLAGLAAAQRLRSAGIKEVVVLEAQDRIGGRVHTIEHSNYLLELGAQWLHGADMNPLYKWLKELDLLDDFEDASIGFRGLYCSNRGSPVDQGLVWKILDALNESKLIMFKNCLSETKSVNAAEVFRHYLEKFLEKDEISESNEEVINSIFDWFLRYESIENSCDSMNEVSISSYTDWTDSGDGALLNFKKGYISLLNWFGHQLHADQLIHLNKEVIRIEQLKKHFDDSLWMDENGVNYDKPILIKFYDPAMKQLEASSNSKVDSITCDHVIVTTSLGFLKKNLIKLFQPPLPTAKKELIDSLGFGTVNKIILEFDYPFWHSSSGIKLLWEETKQTLDMEKFPNWCRDIIAFDTVRRQPNLLIGWIGGKGAKLMELQENAEIAKTCLKILDTFLPKEHPKPTRLVTCICSRWNSNPFVCGSYSFQSMDSFDKKLEKLHEPIYSDSESGTILGSKSTNRAPRMPRIMFAGEATAGKLYSTTHGAIISGWREADRLVEAISAAREFQPIIEGSLTSEMTPAISSSLLMNA